MEIGLHGEKDIDTQNIIMISLRFNTSPNLIDGTAIRASLLSENHLAQFADQQFLSRYLQLSVLTASVKNINCTP